MFARTERSSALSAYRGLVTGVRNQDGSRTLVNDDQCYGFGLGGEGDSIYSLEGTTCYDILEKA
jgi:hypothetical protein